ncbi:CRR6 family NdhI maturation factor [Phormidium sp. CCY1219]|uniref:CRR6 family NdhI maturation factor n=1 Tax=Phormidium sp. CCY1219 TaxID=2886104 RepID=UPI002D1F5064|nr:CRR6 family NdhI maturation factor [Phormidium sp. CCY1219]MEB3827253.1 CRR6 family NdhI maturation factor [Phormidium sp. CCY1219]
MAITTIALNAQSVRHLDFSAAQSAIETLLQNGALSDPQQCLRFDLDYPRDPTDPRELSEIPEVRLWFIGLDARYPWLPILLDWKQGELARYTAMLVPHQFHRVEGIQYNPEALEIFLMHKIFTIAPWLQQQGLSPKSKLLSMAQMLGYDLDEAFFDLVWPQS